MVTGGFENIWKFEGILLEKNVLYHKIGPMTISSDTNIVVYLFNLHKISLLHYKTLKVADPLSFPFQLLNGQCSIT